MKPLSPSDPFWDELGIVWTAIRPESSIIIPRIEVRIRRQAVLINAGVVAGFLAAFAAALLSAYCIWTGLHTGAWNFVLRGVAFAAIVVIVSLAVSAMLRVRANDGMRSLSQMLNLVIARLRKTLLITRLGFAACGITALLGLAGAIVRTHLSRPPAVSPIVDVALLAALALGLFLYGRRVQRDLRKYTQLKRLTADKQEER